ncbi:hypothetical protein, partial [Nocardia wallacei]|uniref:hypothetical protein n=1 Tax=Nocardia wallacei TaxID=480035 RepID=UPI002454A28E
MCAGGYRGWARAARVPGGGAGPPARGRAGGAAPADRILEALAHQRYRHEYIGRDRGGAGHRRGFFGPVVN